MTNAAPAAGPENAHPRPVKGCRWIIPIAFCPTCFHTYSFAGEPYCDNRCQECLDGGEGERCPLNRDIAETQMLPGDPENCSECNLDSQRSTTPSDEKHPNDRYLERGATASTGAKPDSENDPRALNDPKPIRESKDSRANESTELGGQFDTSLAEYDAKCHQRLNSRARRALLKPWTEANHSFFTSSCEASSGSDTRLDVSDDNKRRKTRPLFPGAKKSLPLIKRSSAISKEVRKELMEAKKKQKEKQPLDLRDLSSEARVDLALEAWGKQWDI